MAMPVWISELQPALRGEVIGPGTAYSWRFRPGAGLRHHHGGGQRRDEPVAQQEPVGFRNDIRAQLADQRPALPPHPLEEATVALRPDVMQPTGEYRDRTSRGNRGAGTRWYGGQGTQMRRGVDAHGAAGNHQVAVRRGLRGQLLRHGAPVVVGRP